MASKLAKTTLISPAQIEPKWLLVDARAKVLGRLAAELATILSGKHRPTYTPCTDTGDFVVVLNASQIRLTGTKSDTKVQQRFSGYPGGLRSVRVDHLLRTNPDRVLRRAVRGMLPRNRLRNHMLSKLKIYAGSDHPHQAQCPQPLELKC